MIATVNDQSLFGHRDHACYAEGKHDGMLVAAEHEKAEIARIRREEVEPLREALREVLELTLADPEDKQAAVILDARAALRAADERVK